MPQHLDRPFHGTVTVSQPFGVTSFAGEPPGFLFPDGSIDYYNAGSGAVRYVHLHSGVDYPLALGVQLYAPADGVVTFAGVDGTGYGNCLKINHGEMTTLYGHLFVFDVKLGQKVRRGDRIAKVGSTGNSTGPHLHWSVIRNSDGRYVDPYPYVTAPVPAPPPAPKPPTDPVTYVKFTVTAMDGSDTFLRDGPSTRFAQTGRIAPGTAINCDAWLRGEPRTDPSTGAFDGRWYHVGEGGFVPSAHVIGNAPGSTP